MKLCDKDKCTGCGACSNVCPIKCIQMIEDFMGFKHPVIDLKSCIKCGLCSSTCSEINKVEFNYPILAYASLSNNPNIVQSSTSGGLGFEFAKSIINSGGKVYGTTLNDNLKIEFEEITNFNDLHKLQGSKYVQSDLKNTFKQILKELKEQKKVLFIGTPCQNAGLKNFLKKNYNNLVQIDIVCHGVPSKKMMDMHIQEITKNKVIPTSVTFRNGNRACFCLETTDSVIYNEYVHKDKYIIGFMNSLILRESCYNCQYSRKERVADIRLGDFWGLPKDSCFSERKKDGVSLCLVNSTKGEKILNEISNCITLEKHSIEESMKKNESFHGTPKRPNSRDFFNYLIKKHYSFSKAVFLALPLKCIELRIRLIVKNIKNTLLKQ